jgi:Flp pilus assembly protein TadD
VGLVHHREAVLSLRHAAALEPTNSRAWYWLALAYHRMGFEQEFAHASDRLGQIDVRLAARLKRSVVAPHRKSPPTSPGK